MQTKFIAEHKCCFIQFTKKKNAQKMFPFFFFKFKTDINLNIYIWFIEFINLCIMKQSVNNINNNKKKRKSSAMGAKYYTENLIRKYCTREVNLN